MIFTELRVYGSAGGVNRTGIVTAHIVATQCDTVASVKALVGAAPSMLDTLRHIAFFCDAEAKKSGRIAATQWTHVANIARSGMTQAETIATEAPTVGPQT